MTTHKVRSSVLSTDEVYVNINDLVIKLMAMADETHSLDERQAILRVVDYLVDKRDKVHSK